MPFILQNHKSASWFIQRPTSRINSSVPANMIDCKFSCSWMLWLNSIYDLLRFPSFSVTKISKLCRMRNTFSTSFSLCSYVLMYCFQLINSYVLCPAFMWCFRFLFFHGWTWNLFDIEKLSRWQLKLNNSLNRPTLALPSNTKTILVIVIGSFAIFLETQKLSQKYFSVLKKNRSF